MATRRYGLPLKRRFQMKRYPLDSLRSLMAEMRICVPGGGGNWSGLTGDGIAWRIDGDRHWQRERDIKRGQWAGPWRYVRVTDIG